MKTNYSASYNETAGPSINELKQIYKAFGAEENVYLSVTPGSQHEMDITKLLDFLTN